MKYYGKFVANNQATYGCYEFSSIKEAVDAMRKIVEGNHYNVAHNKSWYIIRNEDGRTITKEHYTSGDWYQGITL